MALIGAAVVAAGSLGPASPTVARPPAMELSFDGKSWLHRWSKAGQNEFTPDGQADLKRWQDMLTLNVHERVRSGDQLAALANAVLARYREAGRILRTASRPRTPERPAEHLIVAVLAADGALEAAFARVLLVDGVGMVAVVARRESGTDAAGQLGPWLEHNGPSLERALMTWTAIPSPAALRQLPATP